VCAHARLLQVLAGGEAAYGALDDKDQYLVRTYRTVKAMLATLPRSQGVIRRNRGPFDDSPGELVALEDILEETELCQIEAPVYAPAPARR
jgi:hypothetical protein